MHRPSRILLVDDHDIVLHGMQALIMSHPELEVCGCAGSGLEAILKAKSLNPDLVVMDLTLPGLNGLDATRQILGDRPGVKILVLTMHASDQLLREIQQVGARGYVLKSEAGRHLISALHAIRDGKTYFRSAREALALAKTTVEPHGAGGILTPREREVLVLLAEGGSNKQVGDRLGISVKTAETHRARIMRKLRITTVADLVRYAIRNDYITP